MLQYVTPGRYQVSIIKYPNKKEQEYEYYYGGL